MTKFTLDSLNAIIVGRAGDASDQSYTASLLSQGKEKCAKKFGEEAVEAVIASASGDHDELVQEAADVLYHLLVMLKAGNVTLEDVMSELDRRTAQTGLEEKASRKG